MRIASIAIALIISVLLMPKAVYAIKSSEYFTYGAGLSDPQIEETRDVLNIDSNVESIEVNEDDYMKYIGGSTKNSSLYSSALVIEKPKGSGVNVYINTPDNITKIQDHQYMNAAITSNVTDIDIVVASPVQVTGESALVGVYKALDESGVEVNEEAAKVANEELTMVKEITENNEEDLDSEDLTLAIAEIKEKIANIDDKDSISDETINEIIDSALDKRGISLSDSDKENIANWINKFKGLDIDWKQVGGQLKKIGGKISEKAGDLYEWGNESGFFNKLWDSIKAFFKTLFS